MFFLMSGWHANREEEAKHAFVSDQDGCHMDAENQVKLGRAVYERIRNLL